MWPLARAEGRRLLRHPLVILGTLGSAALFGASIWNHAPVLQRDDVLTAGSLLPLAITALIAASLCALRSRRHGTDELYDTTATPPHARVTANLVSCLWPAALGVVIVAAEVIALIWLRPVGRPDPLELLAGPVEVLLAGALGVALAKLVPSVAVGPVAVVAIGAIQLYLLYRTPGSMYRFSRFRWLAVWVPIASGLTPPRESVIRPIAWHLLYLLGLTLVVAGVALVRTRSRRGTKAVVAAGLALALVAGFVQTRQPTAAQEARLLALVDHPDRFQVCRAADGVRYCAYPGYAGWIDRWALIVNGVLREVPPAQRPQDLVVRQHFSTTYGGDLPREAEQSSVLDGGRAIEPGTDWGRGSVEGQYQIALALPVAARATGLPSTMKEVSLTPAEIDHLVKSSPIEQQAQLREALESGNVLVGCSPSGQAREVVAIWLAAQSTPEAERALRSFVEQDPYGFVVYRGHGTAGIGFTGPDQYELSNIGDQLGSFTPILWTKAGANYALQLLSQPRERVATKLAANWDLLMRPATSLDQLVRVLGLRTLPTLEQQLRAAGQDPSQAAQLERAAQSPDQIPCR